MEYGNLVVTVTTAGTRVPLSATSVRCRWILIRAEDASGTRYLGGSAVTAANGMPISSSEPFFMPPIGESNRHDLKDLYLDASANGLAVRVLYAKK